MPGRAAARRAREARGRGLDTCPQVAFADFRAALRQELGIPQNEIIICGLALGYADPDAVENRLVTERASADQFGTFDGFTNQDHP